MADPAGGVVVDASVLVDLLAGTALAEAAGTALSGHVLHAPAHLDAEVLSALGRLERGGDLTAAAARRAVGQLADAPVSRHPLPELLPAAFRRRADLRLTDALYVALAARFDVPLVTSDRRLARAGRVPRMVVLDASS